MRNKKFCSIRLGLIIAKNWRFLGKELFFLAKKVSQKKLRKLKN